MYNGETLKGIGLFFGAIIATAIVNVFGLIVVIVAVYDAYSTANKINEGRVTFLGKNILFWPVIILYVFLIIVVVGAVGIFASLL